MLITPTMTERNTIAVRRQHQHRHHERHDDVDEDERVHTASVPHGRLEGRGVRSVLSPLAPDDGVTDARDAQSAPTRNAPMTIPTTADRSASSAWILGSRCDILYRFS